MYNSGDAAEQVVRMSLEGAEVALKITGVAAKNLAAAIYTVLKDQKKTKGKARIEAMLRERRPLKVYTIKKEDCPEFAKQAKGYGILYAPIPVRKEDDTIDILVFEDDAARANRIVEKFNLTVVDTASIKEDIEKSREERGSEPQAPEKTAPEKSEDDKLLDELMENQPKKRKASRKTRRRRKAPLFPQRRKNPIRPRLSQRTAASPQGVLLMSRRSLPSVRSFVTSRPSGRKRRRLRSWRNRLHPKRKRPRKPRGTSRPNPKRNQNRKRGNRK